MSFVNELHNSMIGRLRGWAASHVLHAAVALYWLAGAAFVFLRAGYNRDEGWCLYASRLVYEGKIPYKDFPYFQGPLLPYVYGLPQLLSGGSLLAGRFTSLALSLITVGAGVYVANRAAGRPAALLFLVITVLTLPAIWTFTMVKTEPLVVPLAMLSLLFLLKEPKGALALVLAPSLMLWATAVRLTALPAFIVVLLFSLYRGRKSPHRWGSVAMLVGLQLILLVIVPLAVAGDRAIFDVWTSQVTRTEQLSATTPSLAALVHDRALFAVTFFDNYPVVAVLTAAAAVFLVLLLARGWQPSIDRINEYPNTVFVLLLLGILLFAPHLLLNPFHPLYFITAVPFLTLAGAIAAARMARHWPSRLPTLAVALAVAGLLVAAGLDFAAHFPGAISTSPERLRFEEVGAYLRSVVPPNGRIITLDPTFALEASRDLAPGLEMADVSYWPSFDDEKAERYGVINLSRLRRLVDDHNTKAVVLNTLDHMLIARGLPPTPSPLASGSQSSAYATQEEQLFDLFPEARDQYRVGRVYPSYGPWPWGGPLVIFLRRD